MGVEALSRRVVRTMNRKSTPQLAMVGPRKLINVNAAGCASGGNCSA